MIKIFISLVLCSFSFLSAISWQEEWAKGVQHCISKEYLKAEENFSSAISQLEKENNLIHPHVYVDRARLLSLLNRDEEALKDLNLAIESPLLEGDDRLRAVVTRLITFYRLNMEDEAKTELETFKSMYPIPKLEVYKDLVVVRNIPECDCSKELLKLFLAQTFCESEDDVKISNGICLAKRKKCEYICCQLGSTVETSLNETKNKIANCKYWCDKMQVAGDIFCAGTFKFFRCQAICIATVEMLKDGCYWCCSSGSPYKTCVKPFEDIIGRMGQGCDPAWD